MDDFASLYCDESFEALVGSMEVRRRMIVMIHPNYDAEEDRDDWHRANMICVVPAIKDRWRPL